MLNPEERAQIEEDKERASKAKSFYDAVNNPYQAFGAGTNDLTYMGLGLTNRRGISWQIPKLDSIMRDVPYFGNASSWKATRALLNGIDLNRCGEDSSDAMLIQSDLADLFHSLHATIRLGDFYGGSGALIITDDVNTEEEYMTPLSASKIKKGGFKGLRPLSRLYQIMPDLAGGLVQTKDISPENGIYGGEELGQPMYYRINISGDVEATSKYFRLHRSRILVYNSIELGWVEKRIEMYFGPSLLERTYADFARYESFMAQISKLAQRSNIPILNMMNLPQASLNGKMFAEFLTGRLKAINFGVSSGGTVVLGDIEKEKFEYASADFTEIPELMKEHKQNFAAALQAPTGVVFNADYETDEHEGKYLIAVKDIQERIVRPWFRKLIPILYKNRFNKQLRDFGFTFKSLEVVSEKEKAEKMKVVVELLSTLFEDNVIDGASYQRMLKAAPNNISDIPNEITQDYIDYVKKGLDGEPFNKMTLDVILATALNQAQVDVEGKSSDSNLAHKTESAQGGKAEGGDPTKRKQPKVKVPIDKNKPKRQ